MKKIDSRHLAFHVVVALYFIWITVFAILLGMALVNTYGSASNPALGMLFMEWIATNLIMGSALFIVIRLFRNRTLLDKIILYSHCFMAVAAVSVVLIINSLR